MARGRTATPWWHRRLGLAVGGSLLVHVIPVLLVRDFGFRKPLELDFDVEVQAVEMGLEHAEAARAPQVQLRPQDDRVLDELMDDPPPDPSARLSPPPRPRANPLSHLWPLPSSSSRPSSHHTLPPASRRAETLPVGEEPLPTAIAALPNVPHTQLPEPGIHPQSREPHLLRDGDLQAENSPDAGPAAVGGLPLDGGTNTGSLAQNTEDSGPAQDAMAVASADVPLVPETIPAIAALMGNLAPMVPEGTLVTLTMDTARIRDGRHARKFGEMLGSLENWQELLRDSGLDPIRHTNQIVVAAANPFGTQNLPPDIFLLVKGLGSRTRLPNAIERMALAALTPVVAPGDAAVAMVRDASDAAQDAAPTNGADADVDAARPNVWTQGTHGERYVRLNRYAGERAFIALPDGTAAVALPGQIDTLMAAFAHRGSPMADRGDTRIVGQLEAEGLKRLLPPASTWRGDFPFPNAMRVVFYQNIDAAGVPDGTVELKGDWTYPDEAEAQKGVEMLNYVILERLPILLRSKVGEAGSVQRRLVDQGARLLSGVGLAEGLNVEATEAALRALHWEVQGAQVKFTAHFTSPQVDSLLELIRLRGMLDTNALAREPGH